MTRLERHYAEQLEEISSKLMRMGGLVEQAIESALDAYERRDAELAQRVRDADVEINRLELEIDQLGLETLVRYQPAARDLRFLIAAMQINTDLERVGDIASNVCKRVQELCEEPPWEAPIDVPGMGRLALRMLHDALDAFVSGNADAARAVIARDEQLDEIMEQAFADLLQAMRDDTAATSRAIRHSFIAKYLERIGDQATNICELVVFMVEGTVIKHPRLTVESDGTAPGSRGAP
ncbi:MAG: phosphate signaling complex protein PhoU [Acidobacteriota bacterium]|nr:MAG: phosphate transport system regulatory protein PhoU [Acidobacteriota bacterium]